jgi:exopolysaccharide biosynthesis polyprenyl glycosylphosphotransferase
MMSIPITCLMLFVHHGLIVKSSLGVRERLLVIVSDENDENVSGLLKRLNPPFMEFVGILDTRNPVSSGISQEETLAGDLSELTNLIEKLGIQSVLCTTSQLRDPQIGENLRKASFSGARLVTLADVMEESFRLVPINLVTPEWLLMASTLPQRSYVRKWKRLFDVFVSLSVGLFALPILLLGMLWVKIASPEGPVFFRQVRKGRLGRPFDVVKLRTMKVDAESNGPQWAKKHDSRVFMGGRWLRKFRIDEIPQLINILKGEMSFVGPRPERPEFADQLASEIPFFRERLLVAPGLTGWAQVRYPYGASVDDAIRKLEYDLYYMKHMTITMDLFILLDTARIVLGGGVSANKRTESCMKEFLHSQAVQNNSLVQLANVELA